jgi:hypothetical protein
MSHPAIKPAKVQLRLNVLEFYQGDLKAISAQEAEDG